MKRRWRIPTQELTIAAASLFRLLETPLIIEQNR